MMTIDQEPAKTNATRCVDKRMSLLDEIDNQIPALLGVADVLACMGASELTEENRDALMLMARIVRESAESAQAATWELIGGLRVAPRAE
jgi:hypothetical protein